MVKFLGTRGGRRVVGIGLSRENMARLLKGEPIGVPLDGAPPDGVGLDVPIDLVIMGGETEETIAAEVAREWQKANP